MATPISLRTLTRESILESLPQLNEILASCVNGGASVSFMQPFSPDTGERFWQRMAQSVAAGERIVLAAENQQRQIVGTVQLIIDQPEKPAAPRRCRQAFGSPKMRAGRGSPGY